MRRFLRPLTPSRPFFLRSGSTLAGFIAILLGASSADAQRSAANAVISRVKDEMMDMTQFFDTVLPGTLKEYNMVLDFSPKFSDLRSREFIRYPLELRYGLSDRVELFAGITPFSPNPINSGYDHRWGIGEITVGGRRNTKNGFWFYDSATYGFESRTPVGKPPLDLIDGYWHVRPFLTASRTLSWPGYTFYTTFSYDRAFNTPKRDRPPLEKILKQHITLVAPGFLYKPGEYGSFWEYDFRHLDEDRGARLSHEVQIGGIWDIPREKTHRWSLPGKWQIELAYRVRKEEGRSVDHGIITRVRVRTTLREVLNSDLTRRLKR